jgi:hypothetical protein
MDESTLLTDQQEPQHPKAAPKRQSFSEKEMRERTFARWGQLKIERATWIGHWQEITTYLLPRQGRYFVQDRNRGGRRHNSIFDNTGTRALYTLAAGLMGGLTSPARPWFRLGTQDPELMRLAPVREWLSQCTRLMLDIFQRSNVYRALASIYLELGAFGTAAALIADDFDNVVHIHPFTVGEYAIATNAKGVVDTFYREFQRTVCQLVDEFGIENVSPTVANTYEQGKGLDTWVTVLHAVEPRHDRDPNMGDARNMPFRSVYYEIGGQDTPLRESGFKRFRVVAPRWDVTGGDVYGNSPAMEALGDVKQLQQEQLRKSQGIDYMTNPPIQVPTNLKNKDVDRLPGGVTFFDSAGGAGSKIESMFKVELNLDHLLADIHDVRSRIRASFYADMFLMLQGDVDTRKTATEVAELHEEKMLMLGPVLERLHNELLNPLIDITFEAMMEAQILPPAPQELQGQDLSVELVSMLAQAQRAIATNGVDRFVANLIGIAQVRPEVLDKLDVDYWADEYSDMLGVDPQFVVPEEKVQLAREQRAKAQAQQAQLAQQEQQANIAKTLATSPTQGGQSTGLDDVMSQFSGYTSQGA